MTVRHCCRRLAILLPVLALLALAATPASSVRLSLAVTGFATPGTNGDVILALQNAGPDPVLGTRVVAPGGKTFDSATANGQPCRLLDVQANSQAFCGPFNPTITAGNHFTEDVHSSDGLAPSDGPFALYATSDGKNELGPFLINWEKPCQCEKIDVSVK